MTKRSTKHIQTKRAAARDDAHSFEKFMAAHNEAMAQRDVEEARLDRAAAEDFADRFVQKAFEGRKGPEREEIC